MAAALATVALTGCQTVVDGAPPTGGVGPGVYGAACPRLPDTAADFPGTAAEFIRAVAGGTDPVLSTLARAVDAAGLWSALGDPDARYTVFAPADAAFEALPAGTLQRWLTGPRTDLLAVLTHHVVVGRYGADGLAAGPEGRTTLAGGALVVTGAPRRLVVDEEQQAQVLCGNIATTNATVFLVDQVLLPGPIR